MYNSIKCYPHPAITFLTKIKPSQKRALFFCFKIQNEKKLTLTREKNREKKLTLTLKKSICYNIYNKKCEKTKHRKNNQITNIRPFPYGKRFFYAFFTSNFRKKGKFEKNLFIYRCKQKSNFQIRGGINMLFVPKFPNYGTGFS